MINKYLVLVERISEYATNLFNQYRGEDLCYHNLEHTQNVVQRSYEIAAHYSLSDAELFIISTAAWFHDTGQLFGGTNLHEDRSVEIMKDFLHKKIEKQILDKIEGCICATKLSQKPKSLLEEIICDADTYNLGTEEFLKTDELLKKEFMLRNIPVNDWKVNTLELLKRHKYFTSYCKALLNKGKEENINLVRYHLQRNDNK